MGPPVVSESTRGRFEDCLRFRGPFDFSSEDSVRWSGLFTAALGWTPKYPAPLLLFFYFLWGQESQGLGILSLETGLDSSKPLAGFLRVILVHMKP